ncbi:MAG: hypoxanthine phosphoribosyltransferase [Gemmatimonadota bacterium]|nr:hypoxanthine phosphoribosyltransferase [Gemmatimonadota bacterium]
MTDSPKVLISETQLRTRVTELAQQISHGYASVDELFLIGILKGAFMFLADLTRALTIRHRVDFIALSSYGMKGARPGAVRLVLDLRESIRDRHVLVVEDIVDTGETLAYLLEMLAARHPASLKTCALVTKPSRRVKPVPLEYVGFEIPDAWVVGYGLDYKERYRTLPYIGTLDGMP